MPFLLVLMRRAWCRWTFGLVVGGGAGVCLMGSFGAWAQPVGAPASVSMALVRTSGSSALEGFLWAGGRWSAQAGIVYSAALVRHGDELLLFDSGLGMHVAEQYQSDMPLVLGWLLRYDEPVSPVRAQLDRAGLGPVRRIVLSHSHWDHASGLADFAEATVWAHPAELDLIRRFLGSGRKSQRGTWRSQVGAPGIRWQAMAFEARPYEGFAQSIDVYGDGSVVLVAMPGHTPGSVGMFVRVDSGRHYFLVGDAIWHTGALREGQPKGWGARWLADADGDAALAVVQQIRAVQQRHPDWAIVPAHDEAAQRTLGYFPAWLP